MVEAGGVANAIAGDPCAGGTLVANDADLGQNIFQAPSTASLTGTYGTFTFNAATGEWKYTLDNADPDTQALAQGATATDTLTVKSLDGTGSYDIVVNITGTNDAPVVSGPVTGSAIEDGASSTLNALANASDVDSGTTLTVNPPATLPAGVTYNALTHSFTLDPANAAYQHLAAGQTATVTVSYGVSDGIATTPGSVSWTVTGTNDTPVAVADSGSTTENLALTVDVLANDTDADDGHVFTLASAAAPAGKGSATIVANQLVFDPGADFDHLAAGVTETVVVSYTMTDDHGASSSSTLTIIVTGTNDTPVAVADSGSTTENLALTVDVLANDTDADDGACVHAGERGRAGRQGQRDDRRQPARVRPRRRLRPSRRRGHRDGGGELHHDRRPWRELDLDPDHHGDRHQRHPGGGRR